MRQAGFLAAACLYAMDHHIERLAEDHASAKLIADAVRDVPDLTLTPAEVETNLVWFEVGGKLGAAKDVAERLKAEGVLVAALGRNVIRIVTHLDASRERPRRRGAIRNWREARAFRRLYQPVAVLKVRSPHAPRGAPRA